MSKHRHSGLNRREFLRAGALGAAGAALAVSASPLMAQPAALASEYVTTFNCSLSAPTVIGATPDGFRQNFSVLDGTAEGPKINGTFLPTGGDWLRVRADGVFVIDVRATLQLDDESLAYVSYPGYCVISQDVFGRIAGGEDVDPSEYYMRIAPRFETASTEYAWLNSALFVATAHLGPQLATVSYDVYQIL